MMKPLISISEISKPISVITITFTTTILLLIYLPHTQNPSLSAKESKPIMATRSFILWLHGLGDSGPANEPIKTLFTSPQFRNTVWSFPSAPSNPVSCNWPANEPIKTLFTSPQFRDTVWSFPSAPSNPVSCNYGAVMPSWFDIPEIPVTAHSPNDESSVLKAVQNVHKIIDKEIDAGTSPDNIFICGFSQGGALTLASVLLYPKTLGGGAIFSGWVPFNSSMLDQVSEAAKKTPILWSHGIVDRTVLFEAGQAGPPFLQRAGLTCEFKAYPNLAHSISSEELNNLESWIKARLHTSS